MAMSDMSASIWSGKKGVSLAVQQAAHEITIKGYADEIASAGQLPPCKNMNPIDPPLRISEYENMERDQGKYLLYSYAIEAAVAAIMMREQLKTGHTGTTSTSFQFNAVIVGPGRGRLIRFVLDAAEKAELPMSNVSIVCIEANAQCIELLNHTYQNDSRVVLINHAYHPCDSSKLPAVADRFRHRCVLSVSELLGCWSDNEFMPEILSAVRRDFMIPVGGVCIPKTWTNYLVPVSSPKISRFLRTSKRSKACPYLVGIDEEGEMLSDCKSVYSGVCDELEPELYSGTLTFEVRPPEPIASDVMTRYSRSDAIDQKMSKRRRKHNHNHNNDDSSEYGHVEMHGVLGYFTSVLFPGFEIDTRRFSPNFNSYHWEAFYFPVVSDPITLAVGDKIEVSVRRLCKGIHPVADKVPVQSSSMQLHSWYEWKLSVYKSSRENLRSQINHDDNWINHDGHCSHVALARSNSKQELPLQGKV